MKWRNYVLGGLVATLAACGGSNVLASRPSSTPLTAKQGCDALASAQVPASSIGLPTRGAIVKSAKLIAATTFLPEYCLVSGEIVSVDSKAEPISFQAAFPTQWNKQLMQIGGGGWNGFIPDVTSDYTTGFRIATGPGDQVPLVRGYVVLASDSGHSTQESIHQAAFTLNDEMLRNFAHESLKKTHDTVAALTKVRYTDPIKRTYFMGGSEGGREAMIVVQRYPADYDGVYSLFPAMNWVPLKMKWQQINRAMRTNGGAGWINPVKAELLSNAQVAACDALDGVKDGLISNVKACTFNVSTLRCPDGVDTGGTCLSDAQLATAQLLYTRVDWNFDLANGVRSTHANLWGTTFTNNLQKTLGQSAEWDPTAIRAGSGTSGVRAGRGMPGGVFAELGAISFLGDSLMRYVILQDANADVLAFDPANPGRYRARLQEVSALLDATNPDISAFIARGGKLIIVHGLSDPLPNAAATTEYYERLVAKFGETELNKNVRYYTVPGLAHGSGPFDTMFGGPSAFINNPNAAVGGLPVLDALENWVENGVAPSTLIASAPNRTRPLCLYPAWPKYKGSGNVDQAANFDCATN